MVSVIHPSAVLRAVEGIEERSTALIKKYTEVQWATRAAIDRVEKRLDREEPRS
jgi:hypothetical protein